MAGQPLTSELDLTQIDRRVQDTDRGRVVDAGGGDLGLAGAVVAHGEDALDGGAFDLERDSLPLGNCCPKRRIRSAPVAGTWTAQLRGFGRSQYARSMSQPAFRRFEKISCLSKGGIEYDFTWYRRQQVRRCRTGRLVAMKILTTEPHCSDLQVCRPFFVFLRSQPSGRLRLQGQTSRDCRGLRNRRLLVT